MWIVLATFDLFLEETRQVGQTVDDTGPVGRNYCADIYGFFPNLILVSKKPHCMSSLGSYIVCGFVLANCLLFPAFICIQNKINELVNSKVWGIDRSPMEVATNAGLRNKNNIVFFLDIQIRFIRYESVWNTLKMRFLKTYIREF